MAVRGIERVSIRGQDPLRIAHLVITTIGILDSVYLSWIKFAHQESRCLAGVGDCFSVNTSRYATIFGIPVAVIGLVGYCLVLLFLLLESRDQGWQANSLMAVFGLTLFGTLFSAYLTFLEIAVIRAICPFCVISAVSMLSLFVISIVRLALPAKEGQSIT